jgi:hypothetical protein
VPKGFIFVYQSRTIFCRAAPNPNITIRNFLIAVRRRCAPSVLAAVTLTGDVCGSASMHIPMWLAWPYAVRLLQCLRQFYDTRDAMALVNGVRPSAR